MINQLLEQVNTSYTDCDKYFYNGKGVPRVTHILSEMLHEEYLLIWANSIGFYRKRYQDERDKAANIGTMVHNAIEHFIQHKIFDKKTAQDTEYYKQVNNGVESFLLWYKDVFNSNNQIEIVGMEGQLVCPYFGGTYDLLIKINGKIYLLDFKTSNHISYKYFLQLAAYKYMLNNIQIDGFIILQVDKNKVSYEEYYLDFSIEEHRLFMEQCTTTFLSLVYAYYNKLQVVHQYNNIFGGGKK